MSIVARPSLPGTNSIVVAKYSRVSTLDQLDGFGLEDQDNISNAWLGRHSDATVHDEYVDEACSGALESRPGMDRLVLDARERRFNRILVARIDRIGRTARSAYLWAWNMADLGIHFISASEGIDTSTDTGWSLFKQYVTCSETEWRRIRERTSAGRELKISYGGWPGGPAPYGYKIVQQSSLIGARRKRFSVLVTDDRESLVLSTAVELVVDQGMNLTEACAELNRLQLVTRSGVPWTVGNLRNRLWSETIHEGCVSYRKTSRGNGKNTTLRYEDGTPAHGETVMIGVPSIISEERVRLLAEALKAIGFRNGRIADQVYPLSGRIDGRCGGVYTGAGRRGEDARAYRCKGMLRGECCGEPHVNANEIEGAVWAELTRLMKGEHRLRATAVEQVSGVLGDKESYEQRVIHFAEKIATQDDLIERRVPEYIKAGVDPAVLQASLTGMRHELEEFRKQKRFAEEWLEGYAEYERQTHGLADLVSCERLGTVTLAERKRIFDMFDVRVALGPMGITAKPGVKCEVSQWHRTTGTLVPPDPSDEEWEAVLAVLRRFFGGRAKKHFITKYSIRGQFCGMLHRLRQGLSWKEMPPTWGPVDPMRARQLAWWKKGAWPEVVGVLGAHERGVEAYRRPTLPQLTITGRFHAAPSAEVRSEAPRFKEGACRPS
ncbi:recombinase family protein [Streptomyces sp. NPDC051784]|uniref:recombinase family protein n=1 Tax=Streptomyces sp. NPDC051784 TaxID=3155805 RepID=UPI00344443D2